MATRAAYCHDLAIAPGTFSTVEGTLLGQVLKTEAAPSACAKQKSRRSALGLVVVYAIQGVVGAFEIVIDLRALIAHLG